MQVAQVFKGANYILTPVDRNKEENLNMIEDLAYEIGFKRVKRITPEYHDEMIGYTSSTSPFISCSIS